MRVAGTTATWRSPHAIRKRQRGKELLRTSVSGTPLASQVGFGGSSMFLAVTTLLIGGLGFVYLKRRGKRKRQA